MTTSQENWQPKAAMVLAAGFGTRMRHLTQDRPKPMVMFAGKPMIDHVLDGLAGAGIKQAVVNVHYKADVLEAHLKQRSIPQIHISDERDTILNTGGGVARALDNYPLLGEDAFLLHNSDSVWYEHEVNNIRALVKAWDSEKMDCLMMLANKEDSIGYSGKGDFHLDLEGRLTRQAGESESDYIFAGVSIQHPRIFAGCPQGAFSINDLWNNALAQGRMYGIPHHGRWMHVGTPEALVEAEAVLAAQV